MTDASENIDSTSMLIRELGQLKGAFFAGLTVVVVLAMGIVALWLIIRHREKTREQAAEETTEAQKEERAVRHASALTGLSDSIREHMQATNESMGIVQNALGSFGVNVANIEQTMHAMRRQIDLVLEKQDGQLTLDQSLAMVEQFFFSVITEKSFGLIALSLMQNNYEQRKDFIQERIKTDIARVLYDVRAALKSLPLSIRPENFFTKVDADGERFVYCDLIWDSVEPLYRNHNTHLGERISELRYKILNVTKDYFEDCRPAACASGTTRTTKKPAGVDTRKHPSSASIRPT